MSVGDERLIDVRYLDIIEYQSAWDLQRHLVTQRAQDVIPDTLLLLQHPPTYTIGRSGGHDHLLVSAAELQAQGAQVIEVDRGGDITYHGPGQLVGYPILQIKNHGRDLHLYLRRLEAVLIEVLATYAIVARRFPGYTGVWVEQEKIAAIGIRVNARGVTSHGFALNVHTNLADFAAIVPCGISDYDVTSLEHLLGKQLMFEDIQSRIVAAFCKEFQLTLQQETIYGNRRFDLGAS